MHLARLPTVALSVGWWLAAGVTFRFGRHLPDHTKALIESTVRRLLPATVRRQIDPGIKAPATTAADAPKAADPKPAAAEPAEAKSEDKSGETKEDALVLTPSEAPAASAFEPLAKAEAAKEEAPKEEAAKAVPKDCLSYRHCCLAKLSARRKGPASRPFGCKVEK